jgi:hypothetical protein
MITYLNVIKPTKILPAPVLSEAQPIYSDRRLIQRLQYDNLFSECVIWLYKARRRVVHKKGYKYVVHYFLFECRNENFERRTVTKIHCQPPILLQTNANYRICDRIGMFQPNILTLSGKEND